MSKQADEIAIDGKGWKQRYTRTLQSLADLPSDKMANCVHMRMPLGQMRLLEAARLVRSVKTMGSDYWPGTKLGWQITSSGLERLEAIRRLETESDTSAKNQS